MANAPAPRHMLNSGMSAHRPRRYRSTDADVPVTSAPPADAPTPPDLPADPPTDADASQDETVPDGMTKVVDLLDWVREGDDPAARAQAVLEWENEKPEQHRRTTLVSDLTDLILEG